jgi:ankyrin repeat protein
MRASSPGPEEDSEYDDTSDDDIGCGRKRMRVDVVQSFENMLASNREAEALETIVGYEDETHALTRESPLHVAARLDRPRVIAALIARGADAASADLKSRRAIHAAAQHGSVRALESLVQHCPPVVRSLDARGNGILHIAAQYGQMEAVRTIMARELVPPAARNAYGDTALMQACIYKHEDVALFMISAHSDLMGIANSLGVTPLMVACEEGLVRVAYAISAARPDLMRARRQAPAASCLMCAVQFGHADIVRMLLGRGCDHLEDVSGTTALRLAVSMCATEMVRILLGAGGPGRAEFVLACKMGHSEMVRLFLQGPAAVPAEWMGGAIAACERQPGFEEVARMLLDAGCDPRYADPDSGETLLHACAAPELCELLIERGADLDALDARGRTPLLKAARLWEDKCSVLIARGADIRAVDRDGNSALMLILMKTTYRNKVPIIRALSLLVNIANANGDSPLHVAMEEESAKELLSLGADPTARNWRGDAPLHSQCAMNNVWAIKLLGQTTASIVNRDGWTILHSASHANAISCVRAILATFGSAMMHARDARGEQATHVCATAGHAHVLRLLVDAGADVQSESAAGWTPLHCAAAGGHLECVSALLAAGAMAAARTGRGWTPLHLAAQFGQAQLVDMLARAARGTEDRTEDGCTPLHLACRRSAWDAALALVRCGADARARDADGRTILDRERMNPRLRVIQHMKGLCIE